jgi:threonine dehydrogenase-like Zn-dependent dehydrogenase
MRAATVVPGLVRDLGAHYHTGPVQPLARGADVVIECTGVGQLVFDAIGTSTPGSIVCLTGISSGGRPLAVDVAALNRSMVLENDVVFGSVNANRRHYEKAAQALAEADPAWLQRLITRRVPLERWHEALQRQPNDVKPIIDLTV